METDESIDSVLGALARAPSRTPPFVIGEVVGGGRYTVHELVGRGGMGAVYRAHDKMLDREVALKLVDDAVTDRLRDEVRLAHEVTHRNVCRTYDLEDIDGRWVVKMELVLGNTLAERVALAKRLPAAEAITIASQIAQGLRAAHDRGVVHRDLKPHNIMLERDSDRVVLMDFGLAVTDGKSGGDSSGTPAFMAPEQVRGDAVDACADLYALGCLIYFMVAGEVVFPADTAEATMGRHVDDPPPALPTGPARLAKLVRRLLAKDPAARPSIAEVTEVLRGSRRRWIALGGAAVVVAAGATVFAWPRASEPWRPIIRDIGPVYEETTSNGVWSPDGTQLAFGSNRDGLMRIYVQSVADGTSHPIGPRDIPMWVPRWARDGKTILAGTYGPRSDTYRLDLRDGGTAENLGQLGWVDDCGHGRLIYTGAGSLGGKLSIREADGRTRVMLALPKGAGAAVVRCDRSGEHATYIRVGDGEPSVWWLSLADGQTKKVVDGPFVAAFSDDDQGLIVTLERDGKSNLYELPIAGGEPTQLTFGEGPDFSAEVSPDGRQLAYFTGTPTFQNTQVVACTLPDGPCRKITAQVAPFTMLGLTPDGARLISVQLAQPRRTIVSISARTGAIDSLTEGHAPIVSRDGRELVFVTGATSSEIVAMPIAGGPRRTVATVDSSISALNIEPGGDLQTCSDVVAWRVPVGGKPVQEAACACVVPAPTGGYAMCIHADNQAFVIAPGRPLDDPTALAIPDMAYDSLAWSPDGTQLYHASEGGPLYRLDVATKTDVVLRRIPIGTFTGLVVSPDGSTLYMLNSDTHTRRHYVVNYGDRPRPR